ncbi:hypothetical protein [Bacillus inaquosorum]|uniref:hypothetical protein n=1 Tax=Bacillus inaquosorum TaxID=483913 RepID=UPI002281569F|nr:hypothetical protein [Bacillus inaquosorum]MCY8493713.1 hypothetical protein [Bacillus inaquosorum]
MGTKKYVRIKKATVDGVWYADRIGQIFEVERLNSVSVLTNRGVHGESSVLVEDVEFIFTEKRKAAVGECVLITDMEDSELRWARYRNYDVGVVREEAEYGGHAYCNINGYSGVLVLRGEYEVIVNSEVKNEEANEMKIDLNAMGYDELMAHGKEVMRMIRIRAYGEGYKQGKFDADMDATYMRPEKTAQARRDEIVEQAKADVKEIRFRHTPEFIVNRQKRTVVSLLRNYLSGMVHEKGIAKAAPSDCFNVHIGKAIALRRALGLAVPDEYLNTPQPTEVRVGDVVEGWAVKDTALVISDDAWPPISGAWIPLKYARQYELRIIDDSREEVGK